MRVRIGERTVETEVETAVARAAVRAVVERVEAARVEVKEAISEAKGVRGDSTLVAPLGCRTGTT
jgi:uncharacterized protein (UPF0335 family)